MHLGVDDFGCVQVSQLSVSDVQVKSCLQCLYRQIVEFQSSKSIVFVVIPPQLDGIVQFGIGVFHQRVRYAQQRLGIREILHQLFGVSGVIVSGHLLFRGNFRIGQRHLYRCAFQGNLSEKA